MTDDKWQLLVEVANKNFRHVSVRNEPLYADLPGGEQEQQGTEDILEFENKAGHFQIIRENKPAVLGKKMTYSHRIGDTARTEYQVSDTELSHKVRVFKEVDEMSDDWEEVTLDKLGI